MLFALLLLGGPANSATEPIKPASAFSIRWIPDPGDGKIVAVEVNGLEPGTLQKLRASNWNLPQWQNLLSVYAEQGDLFADVGLPSMLGAYGVEGGALRFQPRFPLEPRVTYRAVFRPARLPGEPRDQGELVTATFQLPAPSSTPTTAVRQIYPSADVLPENLLKFYVHFTAPMSRGHIYDHIHLREGSGKDIELPFLEIDEELWNPAMTRLTLFIDPGRIKRGVRPLEEIGPALEEGKRYTLRIDAAWKDAAGNPLKESFAKTFQVGPADREPPDPARWRIEPPKPASREPLVVTFSGPMDHALAQRVIRVQRPPGESLDGEVELADQERRWIFTPREPWRRGSYQLLVQTTIEDLAGNNIGKPFEVDLFEGVQRRVTHANVNLPFEVR